MTNGSCYTIHNKAIMLEKIYSQVSLNLCVHINRTVRKITSQKTCEEFLVISDLHSEGVYTCWKKKPHHKNDLLVNHWKSCTTKIRTVTHRCSILQFALLGIAYTEQSVDIRTCTQVFIYRRFIHKLNVTKIKHLPMFFQHICMMNIYKYT